MDFTIKFEHTALSILPDCVFIIIALARIWYLSRQGSKLSRPGYVHFAAKVFSALFLIGTGFSTYLVLYSHLQTLGLPKVTLLSSSFSLGASIILAPLLGLEHFRSLTPSSMVLTYSLLKGCFNAVILRTYILLGTSNPPMEQGAFSPALVFHTRDRFLFSSASPTSSRQFVVVGILGLASHFVILFVESIQKRRLFNNTYQDYSKECSTSIFTRLTFYWLFPLLLRGSKTKLGLDDLTNIPPPFKAVASRASLELELSKSRSLIRASLISFGFSFISPLIACLVLVFATFAQPFLVNELLLYIQSGSRKSEEGWAIVASFVVVYGILTLATAVYWEKVFNAVVKYRGALVGSILQKSLRIASHESREIGPAKAATYMSVDVGQISEGIERFYDVFGSVVSIVLGIVILYSKTQWAAFMPIAVIILTMSVTSYCGKIIGQRYGAWMAATDKRVKLTASVISNLIPIKMSAYESPLATKLGVLRDAEMGRASKFFSLLAVNITVSNASSIFCSVTVLGTYAVMVQRDPTKGTFDAASVFTILTTVQLLTLPLGKFLPPIPAFNPTIGQVLPSLFSSYTSLKRVEAFLNIEDKPTSDSGDNTSSLDSPAQRTAEFDVVRLSGVSAAWDRKAKPALNDIDLTLESGKLYMCIGPVASGKTSLLNTMLGEMVITKGSLLATQSSIAYVAQDAFIFPGTIRENVTFGASFDSVRYESVIAGCALGPDLARLDEGDMTMLGDKGTTLSGGQKQRVALARAVYSDVPVVFLDDPLSALDAETEKHVAEALFGISGLLKGRTVLMITHNVRHLPYADGIVVMDQGTTAFQGSLDQLQASGYDLARLIQVAESPSKDESREKKDQSVAWNDQRDIKKPNGAGRNDELKKSYIPQGLRPYRFWAHMAGGHRVATSLSLIGFSAILSMGMNVYAKFWSDDNEHIVKWILGYFGISVGYFTFTMLAFSHWYKRTSIVASKAIHEKGLEALMAAPASYIQNTSSGLLINRFSQDLAVVGFGLPMSIFGTFSATVLLGGSLILIAVATPWLATGFPLLAVAYWYLIRFYLATSTQLQQLESASKSPLFSAFGTIITGLETIRSFGSQRMFSHLSDGYLNASQGPLYYRFAGVRFLRTTLSFITMLIAVSMACLAVGMRNTTSAGLLGIALINMTKVSRQLAGLLTSWVNLENGAVAVERVREIAGLEAELDEGHSTVSNNWPTEGSISFEDFSMRYSPESPLVLRDLSINIQGGLRVGICGRTGSGKSSMVNALFRTVDSGLHSGGLSIDGIDINDLPLRTLRSALSIVPQDPFLWHSTIRENLDVQAISEDDQIWRALDIVGMKEAILELKDKLDTVLEDSVGFSRGQRQLLCTARVLLQNRKIVILDEASSSMDTKTDEKIQQVISESLKGCTVLAVAHRISTIVDFDLVMIMDDGTLVETGHPRTLLENKSSRFAKLAMDQGIEC